MLRINCLSLGAGLLTMLFSLGVQAQEVTTVKTIVTPPPTAVCTTVEGHWKDNVWIAAHEICRYDNRTEGVAWVRDYWSCTAVDNDYNCTSWELVPGHWVKTLD